MKAPRHVLVFAVAADGIVDILGIVHERMLLASALARILKARPDDTP